MRALLSLSLAALAACAGNGSPDDLGTRDDDDTARRSSSVISFPESGAAPAASPVIAGTTVKVAYEAQRLLAGHPECLVNHVGTVQMGARFNGDASRTYYFPSFDELPLPGDVRRLELWFSCGANAYHDQAYDSRGGANYAFDVAPAPLAGELRSLRTAKNDGLDLRVHVGAESTEGGHFSRQHFVTVTYQDLTGFAGSDAAAIHAWVGTTTRVAHHGGFTDGPVTAGHMVSLGRQGAGLFAGTVELDLGGAVGDSEENLDAVEVAVTNDRGGWDSNDGRNYRFSLR